MAASPRTAISDLVSTLAAQYGCGPVKFSGAEEALYERHLLFDNIVDANDITLRERYEAVARSVRDILSQRWILTEGTYERENPKRIYYLSIEFLLGRSLGNNITNLMLDPLAGRTYQGQEPRLARPARAGTGPGLGNGGLGRLAACFLDSMATMQLPATGYGLRYEYGMFKQSIKDGWQEEPPDHWLRSTDPWQIMRAQESCRSEAELLLRDERRKLARRCRASHRRCSASRRSPDSRLWRQDDQFTSAVGRRRAGLL